MCGIAGIVLRREGLPHDRVRFDQMVDSMISRGPDDRGTVIRGRTALGARRLSIVDLEAGSQPIASEDGSVHVVLNGEIYNHVELRSDLQRAGHRFRTRCDTEVLAHGYEQWGIGGLLDRLNGMFAFAVMDVRRDRVLVARDRLGIKPLLYADTAHAFCFASSMSALLTSGHVNLEPDPVGVRLYLHTQFTPAPYTVVRGVHKLPPASYICIDRGRACAPRRYWALPRHQEQLGDAKWRARLRDRLGEAVRMRMVADVDVGAFASGGLDSSVILSLMGRPPGQRVQTFSVAVRAGPGYDEEPFARLAARRFDAQMHVCGFTARDAVRIIPALVSNMDEPVGDTACLPTYALCRQARRRVKVALSGEGADELFAGYRYYRSFNGPFARLRQILDPRRNGFSASRPSHDLERAFDRTERSAWSGYPYAFPAPVCERLVGALEADVDVETVQTEIERCCALAAPPDPLARALAVDIGTWLPDNLLAKVDRMSMAHGLEVRVPFLDHHVVEAAMQIPSSLKVRGRVGKAILRDAFGFRLGHTLRNRRKHGFSVPLGDWLRNDMQTLMRDWNAHAWPATPWLECGVMQELIDVHGSGRVDLARQVWLMFVLTAWFARAHGVARAPRRVAVEQVRPGLLARPA